MHSSATIHMWMIESNSCCDFHAFLIIACDSLQWTYFLCVICLSHILFQPLSCIKLKRLIWKMFFAAIETSSAASCYLTIKASFLLVLTLHDNGKIYHFKCEASENKFECVEKLTIKWHSSSIYDWFTLNIVKRSIVSCQA